MVVQKPCPFCDTYRQEMYRFHAGFDVASGVVIRNLDDNGDMFSIVCDCGCELVKCQDELVDKIWERYGCDSECNEHDLWGIMIEEWNKRPK